MKLVRHIYAGIMVTDMGQQAQAENTFNEGV